MTKNYSSLHGSRRYTAWGQKVKQLIGSGLFLFFLEFPFSNILSQANNPFYSAMQPAKGTVAKEAARNGEALAHLLARATEDTAKRTMYSNVWTTAKGEYIQLFSKEMVNYEDKPGHFTPVIIKLQSCSSGWVAARQPSPCYFNLDRTTAIDLGKGLNGGDYKFVFNKNCKVNGTEYPQTIISLSDDKIKLKLDDDMTKNILFQKNGIETEYIIGKPLGNKLEVTEDLEIPEGYTIQPETATGGRRLSGNLWQGDLLLLSAEGKPMAEIMAPVIYDSTRKNWCEGYYKTETVNGKTVLHTIVPQRWLATASYPVTIDPQIKGPRTNWPLTRTIPSALWPRFNTDSLYITIPGKITITHFLISYCFETNLQDGVLYSYGRIYFKTPCTKTPILSCDSAVNLPGYCYVDTARNGNGYNNDFGPNSPYFGSQLTCCFNPECYDQHFYLTVGLSRDCGGGCQPAGLDSTKWLWTPRAPTPYPFYAYIIGYTDTAQYTVPTQTCSNSCNINMDLSAWYGVPPYKASHPWAARDSVFGNDGNPPTTCNQSTGSIVMPLTLPNCPTYCLRDTTITCPPPIVVDACGDTAKGLRPTNIKIIPTPKITPADTTIKLCSGNQVNFNFTSCVPGSTYSWKASNNTNGTNPGVSFTGSDTTRIPAAINYSATCSYNGCPSPDTAHVTVIVLPMPNPTVSRDTTITAGNSVNLYATGGTSYQWTPATGLSCINCATPVASPTVTTIYTVTITDSAGCTSVLDVTIDVNLPCSDFTVPNVFTPNNDGINDDFVVDVRNPSSYSIYIYDRWGRVVYSSSDPNVYWNGRINKTDYLAPDGVYYYVIKATCFNQNYEHKGFVQLIGEKN